MNLGKVAQILAGFALFFSLVQAVPLVYSLLGEEAALAEFQPRTGFQIGIGTGVGVAALLSLLGRRANKDFFRRESLAVVGLAWLLAGSLGAVPFLASGALRDPLDAFFEGVSGLTTTGATVLGTADNPTIEALPRSLLLWRAMLQWMGGLGIILAFIVLLPALGVTGKNLLDSEQIGVSDDRVRPRMQRQARALFALYVILTTADALLLWSAGMGGFDAACHSMTTLASGGFSTRNLSIGAYQSVTIEIITVVFMFLAGCSFVLLLSVARNRAQSLRTLLGNPEFRVYLGLTTGLILAMTVILRVWGHDMTSPRALGGSHDYSSVWWCLRDASFQVTSILTSTGYCNADFQNWPKPALLLLIICMFVGGSSGSTAGGLKVVRIIVSFKLVLYTLRHYLRPKSVEKLRVGSSLVPNSVVSAVLSLILLWIGGVLIGAMALGLDPRLDLLSAVSASISMMGCTGPCLTEVVWNGQTFEVANAGGINLGPLGGYGDLHGANKLLLSLQMILGRLEILALFVLLVPAFWRK